MKSTKQMELEDCLWAFGTLGLFFFMGFMFRGCTSTPAMAYSNYYDERCPEDNSGKFGDNLCGSFITLYSSGDAVGTQNLQNFLEQNKLRIIRDGEYK